MDTEKLSWELMKTYLSNFSKDPTPCQTQKIISQNTFITGLSELTGIQNTFVLEKVFIKKNKPLTHNAENFIKSLEEFKKNDEKALLKITLLDEKCIREKTGKLDTRRLTKLYNNSVI